MLLIYRQLFSLDYFAIKNQQKIYPAADSRRRRKFEITSGISQVLGEKRKRGSKNSEGKKENNN